MTETRRRILRALEQLSDRYPDWRFGQMVANISYWAKETTAEAIWDVEDEEFLNGIRTHLEHEAERSNV
ncbi:MAG TPA: hypothetical protein VG013_05515 [Gemmataceae bacterium]|jgi:hypothetical protein|nr:hypothetical protein [Gemmataceae bacterium]